MDSQRSTEPYYMHEGKFETEFPDVAGRHWRAWENNTIVAPDEKFADSLIKKYLVTAPVDFQVHRPPKVIDLTQTLGDGITSFEKD